MLATILPMAMSCDAGSCDQVLRNITFHFGLYSLYVPFDDPAAATFSDTIRVRGQLPGAYCERSGWYFPGEHLTTDADGRTVGRPFRTTANPMRNP